MSGTGPRMAELSDKVVVVTGAGRGLGRAYACDLAARGARVLVNGIDASVDATVEEIRAAGGVAIASVNSVSDIDAVRAMFALAEAELGSIHGLVNNAGLIHDSEPWADDPETVRRLIEVNVFGSMLCGMEASRLIERHGAGGSIVNISSSASFGRRTVWSYSASKGAIAALTYAWALSMPDIGIRVNCVAPYARTAMSDGGAESGAFVIDPRWVPERISPLIAYLLSDVARDVNGHFVRFDGERLTAVARPRLSDHSVVHEDWGIEDLASAFDGVFIPQLADLPT